MNEMSIGESDLPLFKININVNLGMKCIITTHPTRHLDLNELKILWNRDNFSANGNTDLVPLYKFSKVAFRKILKVRELCEMVNTFVASKNILVGRIYENIETTKLM